MKRVIILLFPRTFLSKNQNGVVIDTSADQSEEWVRVLLLPLSILRANQSSRVFYSDGPLTQRDVELADQERLMSVRELLI